MARHSLSSAFFRLSLAKLSTSYNVLLNLQSSPDAMQTTLSSFHLFFSLLYLSSSLFTSILLVICSMVKFGAKEALHRLKCLASLAMCSTEPVHRLRIMGSRYHPCSLAFSCTRYPISPRVHGFITRNSDSKPTDTRRLLEYKIELN